MEHDHVEIRGRGRELVEIAAMLDEVHAFAGEGRGIRKLILQIAAVVDQHDLVVLQVLAVAELLDQEHHGERLARALSVPDDPAPFEGGLAGAEARDDLAHRPPGAWARSACRRFRSARP